MKQYVYPEEVIHYVKKHYRKMSDRVMRLRLIELFPDLHFSPKTIATIRKEHGLTKSLAKTVAFLKVHEKRSPPTGAILYKKYHGKEQWVIKLAPNKWRSYAGYFWNQNHGRIPYGFEPGWEDELAPLTENNLVLKRTKAPNMPVGSITIWKHEGRERELIKTAPGKYELYWPYLWRQNYGEIPADCYVDKIDPTEPATIRNLYLVELGVVAASKNLEDSYIIGSLKNSKETRGMAVMLQNKALDPEVVGKIIETKREHIQFKREIKKHKENARNSPGSTTDYPVEGAPTEDGELFVHGRWYRD
jgi:hypothetical protein